MGYKRQQPLGNSSHRKIPPKPHCHAGTGVAGSLSLPVVAGRPGLLVPQEQQLQRRGDGDPCGPPRASRPLVLTPDGRQLPGPSAVRGGRVADALPVSAATAIGPDCAGHSSRAGDRGASGARPPSRNRETPILLVRRGAPAHWRRQGEGRPGSLVAPGSWQWTGTRAPATGSDAPRPASLQRLSLYSFDLCLGRVRFAFGHFLWASRPLGSSWPPAPSFPFSLRRLPSCGQPHRPRGPGLRRECAGGVPLALCPPSPLVASPAPKFAPQTASLRSSERGRGVSTSRSPPGAGAWRPALTLEAATLPPSPHRVPLSPPAPLDSGATQSWPLGERPSPGGNAQRLSIWAAQTVPRSGRAWGSNQEEGGVDLKAVETRLYLYCFNLS
ncbi:uncharacterized protein LOC130708707 [Balaenoptera acutorostrata]|uniref:Uncharacterized protein LOC130708707 n=1 Tax=Balaenoptera acutorostrata TaxID=9767 RepID=A0ABM3TZ45_BALAC|nr:uncharacterized protein LOC130708707 [Balaenoptera acutorostrata]